jgi:hypothetical protein
MTWWRCKDLNGAARDKSRLGLETTRAFPAKLLLIVALIQAKAPESSLFTDLL